MRFRIWLENTMDNSTSWLDPGGKFHPTAPYKSHADWAQANQTNLQSLFQQGWIRVTFVGNELWVSNYGGKPVNQLQKSSLIDFAMTSGRFRSVSFDNGADDFVLWSQ